MDLFSHSLFLPNNFGRTVCKIKFSDMRGEFGFSKR